MERIVAQIKWKKRKAKRDLKWEKAKSPNLDDPFNKRMKKWMIEIQPIKTTSF